MKLSEQWLRTWINPKLDSEQLAAQLTMAGLEVEEILPAAPNFSEIIVGEVLAVEPHPDAERLKVCQVEVGTKQPLNIVCGASNVRIGIKVPVALVGAVLPNGLKIKKARLRGVESQGMLCSAAEVGLPEIVTKGLMELPLDAPLGINFSDYLQLRDCIINLNITPNRGDCLSVMGLAREVAALNDCSLILPSIEPVKASITDIFPVSVLAPEACPRYVGRVIRNINPPVLSPLWLQEKLRRSGLRSIHPVVDIANYVMLELGQPLHAFDLQQLTDEIEVRFARLDEKIILLNEKQVTLTTDTLVIADRKQPQAIAGIMGGLVSSVSSATKNLFLESAYFNPQVVATTLRHTAMQSDAGYRFERGVDSHLQKKAIERATALILEICGGKAGPIIEVTNTNNLPSIQAIYLRRQRIERILGHTINDQEVIKILQRLGMVVEQQAEGWRVEVPSYRFDIIAEIDLIEELARIYGYAQFQATRPKSFLKNASASEKLMPLKRIKDMLVDKGYHEVITYSFVAPSLQAEISGQQSALFLTNPISNDMSVMRTQLWPGLLKTALYNCNRQQSRIRVFEAGLCFIQQAEKIVQCAKLGGLVMGNAYPQQWGATSRCVDFFDIKNDLEALFNLTKRSKEWKFQLSRHHGLHPNQTAEIYLGEHAVGYLGALHPKHQQSLGLPSPVFLFELDLMALQQCQIPLYCTLSKFPVIRRDLAIVVDKKIPIQAINEKIMGSADSLLQQVHLFDIYRGKGIDLEKKSLALSLTFQHTSRTLIDEEINTLLQRIIKDLQQEFNAKLRE